MHQARGTVHLSKTAHQPGAKLALHSEAVAYLSVVIRGSYVERVGRSRLECLPLQLRLHPSGEEHAHDVGRAGAVCLIIKLSYGWGESIQALALRAPEPLVVEAVTWRAIEEAVVHDRGGPTHALYLESLAADLLELCEKRLSLRRAAESSAAVRRAVEMIEDCLAEPLTITALAAAARLHPTHFARSFRATTGYTPGEYIRRRRVAHAQTLFLKSPAFSLSRVAAEAGFADHAHLTRTFRKVLGMVPSTYRSALKGQAGVRETESAVRL